MKRIFSAVILILILATAAFGLSDKDYKRMMKMSKAFREANRFLNEAYRECRENLPQSEFHKVQREQREWLETDRDEEAEYLIEDGMKRTEAYTKVTEMRAHDLHRICVKYKNEHYSSHQNKKPLERKPFEHVKTDNFYSIYERRDGVFFETRGKGDKLRVIFSDYDFKWAGEGTLNGQKVVLRDRKNRRVTLTFNKWNNELITVITVNGGDELNRLNGTYRAYEGHA